MVWVARESRVAALRRPAAIDGTSAAIEPFTGHDPQCV